jgi:GNAT superfamily N-acetyltransferase
MRLGDFRKQYPQYSDISDEDLARGLHRRFYSDIPFEDFSQRVGLITAESGFFPALKAGVSGVQEAGYALAGRTGLMDEAAAQKAIEEQQAYQQRVFAPTEEGFLEAPVTKTVELLGQSLPYMAAPLVAAGAALTLPVTGTAATVAGLGAAGLASGAQFTGTNLLRQMEPTDEAPQGKSIGETDLGNAALAAVPQAALDVLSLRMIPFIRGVFGQVGKDLGEEEARRIASKNLKDVAADYTLATGKTMTVEGLTEAAQQSLERLQAGLTMTDQSARDEYLESFIGGAVLGGVLAPPGRYLERRAAQKEVPPETKPEPTATQPTAPRPITDEDELTPEEEADLQARIAAAPPAAGLPVAPTPTPPISPAPATATPEAVALPETQQVTPQAAPELEVLTAQLARIQQARMDPTLSPDDPAFLEFDQQEAAIQARIQQLTAPPAAVTQPPAQPLAPVVEPEVIPEDAIVKSEIQVPFDETLTPPGPSLEDQVRTQKAEERRERQAAQEAKKGEFVLQNRDRSSTGSIQQMQSIANAPDYSRAGFSRTPDGAPIIAFGDYAPERLGREDVVTTARGRKIPVQYAVVEADEVITSNDIQGRADNRYGDKSVPGPRAIAGNGRITGLRESFERGTATPYVEEMAADSTLHGISPDVIAGMKKPVLVRVMPQEGLTRDIGDELNISSMLELSPVEQAKNDLNRVDFEGLQFNEEGEITNESLSQFIAAQPVEERTKLIDRGLPTKQARQRLENAIFARAYADDDLIAMFAQTEDVEARLVINALAQVAPQMAQLEGAGDLDIRDIVTDAAKIIVSGKRRGLKLKEISAQVDMTVDPDTKIIVDMFAQNPRSNKAAIESLRNAAEMAYNESIRPEEGLFGVEPRRERRDIVEQMRRGYEPTRTEDVAEAQRPGAAPSDVERKAEPIAAGVPQADQDFVLTGQTPEELAELRRKELSGEAEAERDRIEAQEAAKAAEIAAKRVAEQKGEQPGDLAPTTGKMELSAPPITDLFGTQGITDQPVRGPRRVAAELSPIEAAAEDAREVEELGSPQEVLDDLVKELGRGSGGIYIQTPDETTILTEETWDGNTTIKRVEFDAIVSLATKKGAKYSITIKDAPTEIVTFTFQPIGLKPSDRRVDMKYVLSKSTLETDVPPLEDNITERMRQLGVADFEDASKKVQEAYGVSKPVADAYVRAVRKQAEAVAKGSYGKGAKSDFQDAYDEAEKLRKRMEGIKRRKKAKAEQAPEKKPEAKKTAKTPLAFYQQMIPDAGFERLELDDPRTYKNKSGEEFLTFERDGVRVAVKSNTQLYAADRGVGMYMGKDNDLLIQAMIVDESARRQGKATKALQDILSMADQAGMTSYIEPVQMTKDVGMTTDQLKDFYKRFGFKPQKTEPATDRVMVREPGAKIETKKEDKPRATTAGMTITEMMAETERVKKQLAEMGMDPDVTYRPEDTSKEKREAKEAKRRTELTRLAGESSRIDKLTREPIIGNPGQRSAAERLARSVDGELLFLDGSRGLGIVFAKDREGNDAYLPIHAGKISRVDVRDFTGLKSTDQAYLKRVRSELVRDAGVRQKRKDDDADMEFMLKGTEDQQKGVRAVARQVGGQPVYFDPETNIGLVRGYGEEAGTPIYAVTMGNRYSENDVEVTTATPFLPYKAKLIEIKNQLEKEAEQKHKDDPFITFENGIAMSSDINQSTGEIFKEWKSMLGLGNVNIYLSTFEDAKKNVDNFTGPHRVIGSGLLKSLTGGRMRRMPDGSYFILFEKSTSKTAVLEMFAHELGHVHEREAYNNAPQELKDKLKEAHEKWVTQRQGKTAREAIEMLRAKTTAQTTKIGADITTVRELDRADPRRYWSSFSEWYADQVSRWAVTDEKPVGVVEKFFARLGAALRRFYQTLKGQKYLPDETFVQYLKQVKPVIVEEIPGPIKDSVQIEMTFDMQKDLFGSTSEAKDIGEAMEVKGKKLPPGRSPELAAAAQAVQAGTMTAEEYNKLVDIYKPIPLYAEPLKPATSEQVFDALDVKKREQINPEIPNGTKVGLRLDIPAFNRKGVFVVSIHQKRTASAPGKVIGYGSVAKAKNVTFGLGNQLKALEIAAGSAKDALQTMEGEYVNVTPEQAFAEAQRAIKDPNYVQIGIDPTRHAYFYDRRTTLPVVSAEEVIQIGNMILAKKPVFGSKQDFLYNIDGGPIAGDTQSDNMSFLDRLRKEDDAKREVMRQETVAYYASIRQKQANLLKQVGKYGSTIDVQRQINNLSEIAKTLKENIDLDRRPTYSAENFLRQARAALDGVSPYKEQAIDPEVFAVIQAVYMDDPKLLEGLRLSIKPEFAAKDEDLRKAFGIRGSAGAFETTRRIVHLYTGTKGVTNPITIRHELTHSLEQMMTPAQRQVVLASYIGALKAATKKHKDVKSQNFFDNVMRFLEKPNRENKQAVNDTLPSYEFYQFVNPSEYWAVNAEKLMAQRLGGSWDRFKKAVRKIFDKLKKLFGFDNRFAVHDVFDQIMSGSKKRLTRDSLASYVLESGEDFEFLQNVEDDAKLVRQYNRAPTSQTDSAPLRRIMIGAAENSKDLFKSMVESPSEAMNFMFNSVARGIIYLRNKNVWFGTGLNEADRIRYSGAVKTAEGLATGSVGLDNMTRGGNIATQVIMQGGIEFNKETQMYGAVKKDKSMANVYRAEARLKQKLGEQLGTDIEQGYLEAKRSRSIIDEVETRTKVVESLNEQIDEMVAASKSLDADPKATQKQKDDVNRKLRRLFKEYSGAAEELKTIKRIREDKVTMSEQEIADFIQREEAHPELKEILDNFNAVNQNLLRLWRDVGLLSEARYNRLSSIKDYVPWYRVMDDDADIHDPVQATTRSATNIGKEKLFKAGKPSVVTDFTVEENQKVFKVQPGTVNAIKLDGIRLKPNQYDVTPNGEITLKVDVKPGQLLVVETQREIENMIDNMTRNVMRMTMNGLRQYAANRIVSEYATREAGKIKRFTSADRNKGRFDYIENGRRTVVEIQDPLIAEAVLGMETVGMKMWEPLAAAANFTRRTITLSPVFQLKQVFKDAPTAALVTGVKNPAALMGGVMRDFIGAVRGDDPVAEILRSQGIGGFYSPARTPEADVKRQIGIINNNTYDYVMKALDHFGDASDMAQRIAIYKRVMAETGDETLALYQAANVINFLRHGSGQVAQALVKTVPFLNAYAQSIVVLYDALRGGGLRGMDRKKALQRLALTGSLLAGTTLLYAMLVGDDDDYMKMDDQSKIRSYMIPGTDVVLPMNTSAAFFFKAIPELLYNKVVNEGTENEVDAKRLRTAMKEAAVDLLLGPTPVPSAVKPVIEIGLDYNFFTSRPVTPRGMQSLDAYQQYDMRTSEAAKILSALTGTKENRVLNPMEADHLVRSIFGTAGAMVAWSSNLVGEAAEFRPEMGLKEMPVTGAFMRPEVPRGREDLFYKLKDDTDRKYRTYMKLTERDNQAEAQAYINRHPNLVAYYEYTSEMDAQLKEINSAIRFIGETRDPSYTPELKRREIQEFLNLKQDILEGIEQFRKEAYAD